MKDPLKLGIVVALGVLLASSIMLVVLSSRVRPVGPGEMVGDAPPTDPLQPDPNLADLVVPPFSLVDQDGKPVTNEAFLGKVTIADFMFTNCPAICPMMTGTLADLSGRLKDVPGVQFMSFSVDPARDTPSVLREYGSKFEADTSRWRFVTDPKGEREATWSIVRDGLKFAIKDAEPVKMPDGTMAANVVHPPHLVLIGPKGKVMGLYYYAVEEDVRALEERARKIAATLKP